MWNSITKTRWIAVALMCLFVLPILESKADNKSKKEVLKQSLKAALRSSGKEKQLYATDTSKGFLKHLHTSADSNIDVGVTGSAKDISCAFLNRYRDLLHNGESDAVFEHVRTFSGGKKRSWTIVRHRQIFAQVPVYGAEITVQVDDASGGVNYVLSDIMRDFEDITSGKISLVPSIDAEFARAVAYDFVARFYGVNDLDVSEGTMMIYDPEVWGDSGPVRLVWQMVVVSISEFTVNEFILIDAHTGKVARHYTRIKDAKHRFVKDLASKRTRSEGQSPIGVPAVDNVYDYLGNTYDFYWTKHGRDSFDDNGKTIDVEVNLNDFNAYWYGIDPYNTREYIQIGELFALQDVVAHEFTHGVTDHMSDLEYAGQSGAINESFSDMWGEWVENDTSGDRWLVGKRDWCGILRSMKDPPAYRDCPDKMSSPNWYGNADVHVNSGVGNKLCYLITDGGTFNGCIISGIGIDKAAKLFYKCQGLLNRSSDYYDLGYAAKTAALDTNLGLNPFEQQSIINACCAVEIVNAVPSNTWIYELPKKDAISGGGQTNIHVHMKTSTPGVYHKKMVIKLEDPDHTVYTYTIPITLTVQ